MEIRKEALKAAASASDGIDVIEAGTLLCVAEGMHAVRALREAASDPMPTSLDVMSSFSTVSCGASARSAAAWSSVSVVAMTL